MTDLTPGARMEGEILLDGENIRAPGVNISELRRKVSMVFEVPTPLPMSIFDNVAYGPRLSGIKNRVLLEELVEESLQMAVLWDEVKDRLHTSALRLSGGQQQRLCIARILALHPEVILLDRPCSGLDPVSTSKIEESLRRLKEKFTIVIVPHNVQQAGRVSDRAAFLLMGDLIEVGLTTEVFANPKDKRTSDYITGRFG
jgi:phosphate transport system ATP-binding protein